MKATAELLQQALRVLEIGLSHEIASKILATVRLLDEKGAEANLMDFALIKACYTEKIESESKDVNVNDIPFIPIQGESVIYDGYLCYVEDAVDGVYKVVNRKDEGFDALINELLPLAGYDYSNGYYLKSFKDCD